MKTLNYKDWLIKMSGVDEILEDNKFNKNQYLNYLKKMKTKTITIKQTETKEGFETNFDVKGFTNWEVLGLLSYYIDAYKINQLKKYKTPCKDNQ